MKRTITSFTAAAAVFTTLSSLTSCGNAQADSEKQRADSLENVIAAMQNNVDSLPYATPEQSGEEQTFSTPDLQLFDIHGHVKSIHANFDYLFVKPDKTVTFDQDGNWTNPQRSMSNLKISYSRDANGRLIRVYTPNVERNEENYWMVFDDRFVWGDNRVEKILYDGNDMYTAYTYNNEGELIKEVSDTASEGTNYVDVTTYSNYKYDDHGNWTSRSYKTVSKEYDDVSPEAGGTHALLNSSTNSGTQTRTITYY